MSDAPDPKTIRDRLGWTQEEMAEHLGINRSNVSRMEKKGIARGPVRKLLDALAEAPSDVPRPDPTPAPVADAPREVV